MRLSPRHPADFGSRPSDSRLVRRCRRGDERAWATLVERYKDLVFSIACRYGARDDQAADLFQAIWLDVYHGLEGLREPAKLRPWLISVARHRSFRWLRSRRTEMERYPPAADGEAEAGSAVDPIAIEDLEHAQLVRETIDSLPPRCRELIRLLFYSDPPLRYRDAAERLGVAVGSIGFIRGRCLQKLLRLLRRRKLV